MSAEYRVPADGVEIEYQVKKSRFIAQAHFASSREQALALLAQARLAYPDARHHCWAYYIGHPQAPSLVAFSDDGEPSGTAGKPILNVLQHKNIGDLMLIVIRYFGGVKLGAGGLVRAYGHAAQLAIDGLRTRAIVALSDYTVAGDFKFEQPIRHWLETHGGAVRQVRYSDCVTLDLQVPAECEQELFDFVSAQGAKLASE
ncbi:YigZ family protein [Simiduia curdlanivorans]|uniref:IMPACT family protein n=1 Tax=Simiduia curdlanivorans TaxID=1492769 RepID=A0ABV8V5B7_9GAMM|nr:YigZ family protein [Simiduia curdlanivorans]MDN3640689.1 YigZ family protein [Simiduia curdlanivorans]